MMEVMSVAGENAVCLSVYLLFSYLQFGLANMFCLSLYIINPRLRTFIKIVPFTTVITILVK